jgi:hypothetical protein
VVAILARSAARKSRAAVAAPGPTEHAKGGIRAGARPLLAVRVFRLPVLLFMLRA